MKYYSLLTVLFLSVVIGCNQKESKKEESASDSVEIIDGHNARISLDYMGEYKGVLPCADCEGIETSLILVDESDYVLKTKYLGKDDGKLFEQRGIYTWNEAGNTVICSYENETAQYFVGENTLTQLDSEGNKITGDLADKYVLKKVVSAVAFASSAAEDNFELTGTKWKLVELYGKPVEKSETSKEDFFIQFDDKSGYAAYAGCNRMAGKYESEQPLRIRFEKGISTLMACPDMTIEQEFAKVLETADNYSIGEDNLSLNKARMAPLARFKAIK